MVLGQRRPGLQLTLDHWTNLAWAGAGGRSSGFSKDSKGGVLMVSLGGVLDKVWSGRWMKLRRHMTVLAKLIPGIVARSRWRLGEKQEEVSA